MHALREWWICWRNRIPSGVTVINSWRGFIFGAYERRNLPGCSFDAEKKYGIFDGAWEVEKGEEGVNGREGKG